MFITKGVINGGCSVAGFTFYFLPNGRFTFLGGLCFCLQEEVVTGFTFYFLHEGFWENYDSVHSMCYQ